MQITVTLNTEQLAVVDEAAARTGIDREQYMKRAAYRMAILEKAGPQAYADIVCGLESAEAGDYASLEEVQAVFTRFKLPA